MVRFNKRGSETGIGTLIIFIALILVSAIAAGVLLRTATSLQNTALLTGTRSRHEVSTAIVAILAYAEDGSTAYSVDDFFIKMKLAPGSDPIKFQNSLLSLNLMNESADLTIRNINESNGEEYNCTYTGNPSDSAYMTENGRGNYSIKYILNGPQAKSGYLTRGDVVILCFRSPRPVHTDEDIRITFAPKIGKPLEIETAIPDLAMHKRVYFFP